MSSARPTRSADRRRRWTLAFAYAALLASCDSPFAPSVQQIGHLEVNPPVLTMTVGGNATLVARVFDETNSVLAGARVFWSTQDPTVVTINQDGVASAVGAGTAQLAASSGGQSRTIAVTVAPRPIALVRVTPPAANVITGQSLSLQGEAIDGNGNVLIGRVLEWTSSEPAIATVDASGLVTGVSVGQSTISAVGEGKVGTAIVTVVPAPIATITVEPNGGSLPAGSTLAMTATPRDANGLALEGRTLDWRSSNDAIATVSAAGLLTAISPGTVTITVSAPGGGAGGTTPRSTVTVTVLVEPVTSALIVPSPVGVQVGQTTNLTVNLFDAAGEPLSPAGRTISWTTSNAAVATVSSTGVVSAVGAGTATVTATIVTPGQSGSIQATTQVNVSNQPVASLVITPSLAVVHAGYSRQFTAVAFDANNQPLPGRAIIWTSGNQGIATVEATTGIVTGIAQGLVDIRATSEGVQATTSVTIDLVRVTLVTVAPSSATLLPNSTQQLTAVARDSAGNFIQGIALGSRPTVWTTDNPAAATVSTGGLVTSVASGTARITATIGGTGGGSDITVNPFPSATQLAVVTEPSASALNDAVFPVQPAVQLKDGQGNNVLTGGILIQAAITAPGTGVLGGTASATTNASGLATFTDLKITGTIGGRSLTFSSGALIPATSAIVNIQAGAPTQLALTAAPPATANSGQVFASPSIVQLRDVSGNDVPQVSALVTAAVSPNTGVTLSGSSATTSGSGAATFGALTLTGAAGTYSLTFSSGALTPVSSGSITLAAGSGSKLSITVQPSATAPNGQVFPQQPVIQLLDGSNNPVALPGVQVLAAIASGGGVLGGTTVATTNASGQATFTNLSITGTVGSRTLLFGANGFTAVTSNAINIIAGPPAALTIVTQPPSSAQSGVAFAAAPAVQLRDASGNAVPQGGVTVNVTLNGAGGSLLGSTSAATNGAGIATFGGLGIAGPVASYSLSFNSSVTTGATSSGISLSAGPAAQLTITTQPAGASSGNAFTTQPAVQVRDAQGNPVNQAGTGITATIASGGPGALIGGGSATTNGSGLAVFSGLGISGTTGSYTIGFASGSLTGVTSATLTLAHGSAAQIVILTQPAGAASGAAFSTQPAVQLRDAQGNAIAQAGIAVSAAIASGPVGSTLVGSGGATTNGSGVAVFSGLGISGTVGSYTLGFSSSGVPSVTSNAIPLAAGAANRLSITTQPGTPVASGTALPTQPAVQVRDAGGNPVPQAGISVTAALTGASLTGTTTVTTDAAGLATFTNLGVTGLVGSYSIAFSSGSLTGATSGAISVTAGAASRLTITTQPGGASSGSAFTSQPAIQLRDAAGNAVSQGGVSIAAAIGSGGPATLLGGGSATTNGSGLAVFSGMELSGTTGNYTIAFSSGSLTGVTSGAFNLGPGGPAQLVIQTQPGGAASGAAFTTQPSILLRDGQGNPVTTAGITVTASISSGSGASFVGTPSASTAASGVATFSGLGLSGPVGNYALDFSASGAPNVTSGSIALAAGAAKVLTMSTQPPSSAQNATALSTAPAVQLHDGAGNAVSANGVSVNVSLAGAGAALSGPASAVTSGGIATFPGLVITGTAGSYSLSFSSGGLTGTTSSAISLTAGSATQLSITTQPPSTGVSDVPFSPQPAIQLRDVSGNAVSSGGVPILASLNGAGASLSGTTTASTGGTGLATFGDLGISGGGTFTITFSGTGLTGATSSNITVTLPATQLAVTSQPSPNATNGAPFAAQPSVQLRDTNGNPVNQSGVVITAAVNGGGPALNGNTQASTINGTATFSGLGLTGTVGTYRLIFTASGLNSATSGNISLAAGAANQLTFNTAPPSIAIANNPFMPQPVVQVRDVSGNPVLTAGIVVGVSIQSGPPGGALIGTPSAATDANGSATFSGLGVTLSGNYALTFAVSGVPGTVSANIAAAFFSELEPASPETPVGPLSAALASAGLSARDARLFITNRDGREPAGDLRGTMTVAENTSQLPTFTGNGAAAPNQSSLTGRAAGLVRNSYSESS